MQSYPYSPAVNALNSNISVSAFTVSFAEGYKFHSLLGSVGELSGDKF